MLIMVHFLHLPVTASPTEAEEILLETGPIAFIKVSHGHDAIFIRDARGENPIFTCASANVIILTPSVSQDGKYITFVVDNGRNQKVVHLLGPIHKAGSKWVADDLELMSIRGGAWPVVKGPGEVYISMPEPNSLVLDKTSNIYLLSEAGIEQITESDTTSSHIWPLIHPNGKSIIYRYIPQADDVGDISEPIRSVILDLETGETTSHFSGQFIFMEQWTQAGDILFSLREKDENGNRVYSLYDPVTGESEVIQRSKSRQGAFATGAKYLATIRPFPAGNAQFDIFVTDVKTRTEINLTNTSDESESLIGWIQP